MKSRRIKAVFLTNIPAPYRVEFFNMLAKEIDLTVLFELPSALNRAASWKYVGKLWFKSVLLKPIIYGVETTLSIDVIRHIKRSKGIIIISGYGSLTSLIASFFSILRRRDYVITIDGLGEGKPISTGIKRLIKAFVLRRAKRCICSGHLDREKLIELGIKKNRIRIIPLSSIHKYDILSSPVSREEKCIIRNKIGMPDSKIFISVGRLIKSKGYQWLVECWESAKLVNSLLVIVGAGPEKKQLTELITDRKLSNVIILDHIDKTELFEYYKASDFFILPTQADAWGLVIIEAMANGLPIIATKECGAASELLSDNGELIRYNNKKQLISALIRFSRLRESEINKIAKHNLCRVSEINLENMVTSHIALLEELQND